MNSFELSYQAHKNNLKQKIIDEKEERFSSIKNKDCINYQIVKKYLDILQPFLKDRRSWLTIGDYNGLEANYLLERGQEAVASDITDIFLQEAEKEGLIKEYREINVEDINLPDDSFDYVLCKEAFHHFPKAYLGLYEMIRCSKNATILIEPIDILSKMPLLLFTKNVLDRINPLIINKIWSNRFSFETVGNYVFKISEREIEKIAMGLGFSCIAFKRINMILNVKLDKSVTSQTPINVRGWKVINRRIKFANLISFLRVIPYNHLCCVVFKTKPDDETRDGMKKAGYMIIDLAENPYLKTMADNAY